MSSISNLIEQFLLEAIGEDDNVIISRNELAHFFSCAPSQINYVLATRFTLDKGFAIDSKRGGGGYITLMRLETENDFITQLINDDVKNGLSFSKSVHVLERLAGEGIITLREFELVKSMLSDKAILSYDKVSKDVLRAGIFKEFLAFLLKRTDETKNGGKEQ